MRSALTWLADTRLGRGVLGRVFRARAKRRLEELDQQSVTRAQNLTLLGLVHKARKTRFGQDHDFGRIHSIRDFHRLVPLRTPAELWREYWQPAFPKLEGATWPGPIPYLTVCASAPNSPFPYVPVSLDLLAARQTAVMTALAFVQHARPQARICSGRLLFAGGAAALTSITGSGRESLEMAALRALPRFLRPIGMACPVSAETPLASNSDPELIRLAERSSRLSVTCLAGTADRLELFLEQVRQASGRERIQEIWPNLAAVLIASDKRDYGHADFTSTLGQTLVLEFDDRLEGTLAVEDPQQRRLRLLPDQGVYFEFVPLEQLGKGKPDRLSSQEVRIGEPYAVSISSPAGIWACLVGSVVRFERLDPPLFRLLDVGKLWERVPTPPTPPLKPPQLKHPFSFQPPHQRTVPAGAARLLRTSRLAAP